ncbi:4-(cytidine 5'-diphospho)-2-C-methyl-D-erythritol kinase [Opitutus sp. ER46]|uniref:4-(cytidine 5'-diphospho)-2-C-methyl-D-erythritol kinase n=1 Tax=Opitutus sp. ER46 TaxID=2161864 RepID=UPI000D306753|nr:4-(cytidine 5'-diphospho)-2-C-methyl-D-erythritol kinase [Opitutus sp. ER46]PTX92553.1 4-(cytidine 5'-diphospho)-2-C-methyl-D-erythritol kinase [Opitutus sp. ER46]
MTAVTQTIFAPAKLNLFLAITGRRPDGFHDLVSVVAPLAFGDELSVTVRRSASLVLTLTCTDPEVPVDESNLILRAGRAFAEAAGWTGTVAFHLEKRIPMGAGLGGGSSNGAAALRVLNRLAGNPLSAEALRDVAATLGSDCPLFLEEAPVVMRGRGERLERLPETAAARLRGRDVLVFKPPFGIPTAWAYRRLAELAAEAGAAGGIYLPAAEAERRLAEWIEAPAAPVEDLLYNNMETAAFAKYLALPTLLDQMRERFGLAPRMTGSGSACFAFTGPGRPMDGLTALIDEAWGKSAWRVATRVA